MFWSFTQEKDIMTTHCMKHGKPWLLLKLWSGGKGVELILSRCFCRVSSSWPKPGRSDMKSRFCSTTSLSLSSSWVTLTEVGLHIKHFLNWTEEELLFVQFLPQTEQSQKRRKIVKKWAVRRGGGFSCTKWYIHDLRRSDNETLTICCFYSRIGAAVAQEGEQSPTNRKVVSGSSPATPGHLSKCPWAKHWTTHCLLMARFSHRCMNVW